MPTTTKGLRYPASSAAPNVPQDIQNLANDVNTALPGAWVVLASGNTAYNAGATASWVTLPSMSGNVTVPTGRTIDVIFQAPKVTVPTSGGVFLRLYIAGVLKRSCALQSNSATGYNIPLLLTANHVGTGASVAVRVDFMGAVAGGFVQGDGDTGPSLEYRIV